MRRFEADQLYRIVGALHFIHGFLISGKEKPIGIMRPTILPGLQNIKLGLQELDLKYSVMQLDRLADALEKDSSSSRLAGTYVEIIEQLNFRIEDELRGCFFLEINANQVKFYEPIEPLFGTPVDDAFPSASPEIEEAGRCLAVGRYSAAVFHLMRTLEVGLNSLAAAMSVPFRDANWQTIIEQIQSKIRGMSKNDGPDWKVDEQFYSEAAVHFRVLKNAWRNYAMHLHERYDEERAHDIWNSVRGFMRHLAGRLHE